jgi:hypothetical protein
MLLKRAAARECMHIFDKVYGLRYIEEPLLQDLLFSKPVQRLHGLAQYGLPDAYYHLDGFTRYEHSVGVMVALRDLGASVKEQAAGLLHDVSHAAFSHLIDWARSTQGKESYQDDRHHDFIAKSEIPAILEKHGVTLEEVTDTHRYALLEQDAPRVCADRYDYAVREMSLTSPSIASQCGVVAHEGRMFMVDKNAAAAFGYGFIDLQTRHWAGPDASARYFLLGSLIKKSLAEGSVTLTDFDGTDEEGLARLAELDPKTVELLKHRDLKLVQDETQYDISTPPKKFRWVDPEFVDGRVWKLSEADPKYARALTHAREQTKGYRLRITV